MSLESQAYAQAEGLLGTLEGRDRALLTALCGTVCLYLTQRLKDGLYVEDCEDAFVMAAAFLAAAAYGRAGGKSDIREFKAGDLTLKQGPADGSQAGEEIMEELAWALMKPYLKEGFRFVGV